MYLPNQDKIATNSDQEMDLYTIQYDVKPHIIFVLVVPLQGTPFPALVALANSLCALSSAYLL